MTLTTFKYALTAIVTVQLAMHIVFAEQNTSTFTKSQSNRFLGHLVRKYGSHGTISFEVSDVNIRCAYMTYQLHQIDAERRSVFFHCPFLKIAFC